MKKLILSLLLLPTIYFAQYTNIPDQNFEQALIDLGHDDVIDGQVLTANINGLFNLQINNQSIEDFTGLESFISLTNLDLTGDFESINLSQLTNLGSLKIWAQNLISLDLSNNLNLYSLELSEVYDLSSLDISQNTNLSSFSMWSQLPSYGYLDFGNGPYPLNFFGDLDFSHMTNLSYVSISGTLIRSLNLKNGNNQNISFYSTDNPYLVCVEVDDPSWSGANWTNVDSHTVFLTNCSSNNPTKTYVPDDEFEAALENKGYGDGIANNNYVYTHIVSNVTDINLGWRNAVSLNGIQDFNSLKSLYAPRNSITVLDLSQNTNLTHVTLTSNQLTSLIVGENNNLKSLICSDNQIASLDLSQNDSLESLYCDRNNLNELKLNNGNNSNMSIQTYLNPNLNCITVDDPSWSLSNWTDIDHHTSFSSDCDACVTKYSKDVITAGDSLVWIDGNTYFTDNNTASHSFTDTTGCNRVVNLDLTVDSAQINFNYEGLTSFCMNDPNPVAQIVGDSGGVFSSSNGLVIDSITGEINLSASQPGNYQVNYTLPEWQKIIDYRFDLLYSGYSFQTARINFQQQILDLLSSDSITGMNQTNNNWWSTYNLNGKKYPFLETRWNIDVDFELLPSVSQIIPDYPWDQLNLALFSGSYSRQIQYQQTLSSNPQAGEIISFNINDYDFTFGNNSVQNAEIILARGRRYAQCCWEYYFKTVGGNGIQVEAKLPRFSTPINITIDNCSQPSLPKTYIPDDNFEAYLEANNMGDGIANNDSVFTDNINGVTYLSVNNQNIASLDGIQAFSNLSSLFCKNNALTSLDISQNTALRNINCRYNQISSLDVSQNSALVSLLCNDNLITSLELSQNPNLKFLGCEDNELTSIDVSQNTALIYFVCGDNQIASLDVSNNTALTYLGCHANQLTELDVSNNSALTVLSFGENQITGIDVSNLNALTRFWCYGNSLTCLNLKNGSNTNLSNFDATDNSDLTCIEVDNPTWAEANWTNLNRNIDTVVTFSINCGYAAGCFASSGGGGDDYSPGAVHCNGTPTEIVEVTNPITGKTWMDRNLGASRAATSSTDEEAYGDLYQWGRAADGHQCRNSNTTTNLSITDQPGHGDFITSNSSVNYDWRSPQNDNLWQGVNGTNNPCPSGYRLPTDTEWEEERLSWTSNNSVGAFASPLKIPTAGSRNSGSGFLTNVSVFGNYWSSGIGSDSSFSRGIGLTDNDSYLPANNHRANGYCVRCIKDY